MSKPFVLHHADQDGCAAALAAFSLFGLEAEYIPVDYGQPMPEIPDGAEVYILDFSYPREELVALSERVDKLVVLEHHETAAKALKDLDFVIHEPKRAACIAAWKHFHPDGEIPGLLLRVEDRDLWKWKYEDTKVVYAYLLMLGQNIARWDDARALYEQDPDAMAERGGALTEFMTAAASVLASEAIPMEIGGGTVVAANVALCWLQSEVGHILLEGHPGVPFVATWRQCKEGKLVFNLRSAGKTNVAKIAEKYGGGGHKNAAGFTVLAPKDLWRIRPEAKNVEAEEVAPVEEAGPIEKLASCDYPAQITGHQAPGVQRDCTIVANDRPGPAGASHQYRVEWFNVRAGEPTEEDGVDLRFHRASERSGQNGLFMEDLLAIIQHRLADYQQGPFACDQNAGALTAVTDALTALHSRTVERMREALVDQE